MSRRSISGRKINKTITSDDILGKDVIDIEGRKIGVAEKVLIDPSELDFVGIEVDKGFLKKGIAIGKSYIERVTEHSILLNIRVAYEIKGMDVFDVHGKKVGAVSEVNLWGNRNKIKNIIVRRRLLKQPLIVSEREIETIGRNVMLKVSLTDLQQKSAK